MSTNIREVSIMKHYEKLLELGCFSKNDLEQITGSEAAAKWLCREYQKKGYIERVKRDLYEGGIRTPFIVSWPGVIEPGTVSFHVSAFWDFLPTMCELIGEKVPAGLDGISYLPTLTGSGSQKQHDYLYWEFHEQGGKQAVLRNNWKLIRLQVDNPAKTRLELYNLSSDPMEVMDVAKQYPEIVETLEKLMNKAHISSELYPFKTEKK